MKRRILPPMATVFASLTLWAACTVERSGTPGDGVAQLNALPSMALETPAPAAFAAYSRAEGQTQRETKVAATLSAVGRNTTATAMLVRNGEVRIAVDSLEPALSQVHLLVDELGGYVGGAGTRTGRGDLRSASIVLRVPAARFDEALAGVRPIGVVEAVSIATEDVSEEYVDVGARMENARRLERRLAQILANRTGALKDVLEVEQALARVREEIERYDGRLRYLRAHAAVSTLTVHLHEPAPLVGHAGASVFGAAVDQAWTNFVSLAVVLVQALGFIVPVGLLAGAAWLGVRKFGHGESSAS